MKQLCLFLLLIVSTQLAFAQKFSFGLKAGAHTNRWHENLKTSDEDIYSSKIDPEYGYELGFVARQKLSDKIYLNEELLFAQRSSSVTNKFTNTRTTSMKNDYVAIPIYLSYVLYPSFNVTIGGQYSRIVKCMPVLHQAAVTDPQYFQDLQLGSAIIGLSYHFAQKFHVELRYIYTFNQLDKYYFVEKSAVVLYDKLNVNARTFSLTVGYDF